MASSDAVLVVLLVAVDNFITHNGNEPTEHAKEHSVEDESPLPVNRSHRCWGNGIVVGESGVNCNLGHVAADAFVVLCNELWTNWLSPTGSNRVVERCMQILMQVPFSEATSDQRLHDGYPTIDSNGS